MVNNEQYAAQILQESLQALQSGKETIDSLMLKHPELDDELRLQLENAFWLQGFQPVLEPSVEFITSSRRRIIARIQAETKAAPVPAPRKSGFLDWLRMPPVMMRAAATVLVIIILFMGTDQVVDTTQSAVPGDPGYTVKRTVENLTLAVSSDPGQQVVLYLEYSQRRLSEADVLIHEARYDEATTVLSEFDSQVNSAVNSLQQVTGIDNSHKQILAMTIHDRMVSHTRQLTLLLAKVPPSTKTALSYALQISQSSLVAADTELMRMNVTPTTSAPAFVDTPTVEGTPVPVFVSETDTPEAADRPTRKPNPEPTQVIVVATQVPPTEAATQAPTVPVVVPVDTSVPTEMPTLPAVTLEPTLPLPTETPFEPTPTLAGVVTSTPVLVDTSTSVPPTDMPTAANTDTSVSPTVTPEPVQLIPVLDTPVFYSPPSILPLPVLATPPLIATGPVNTVDPTSTPTG